MRITVQGMIDTVSKILSKAISKSRMLITHNKWCEAFQLHLKENQEHEQMKDCSKKKINI